MANIEYTVAITPEHTLVVNSDPVPYPGHIEEGDSENLLIWALDLVAEQHDRDEGSTLGLWLDDQREGGYGKNTVKKLAPGQNVTIDALRQRAGFTYTPPADTEEEQQEEPAPAEPVWEDEGDEPETSPASAPSPDAPPESEQEEEQETRKSRKKAKAEKSEKKPREKRAKKEKGKAKKSKEKPPKKGADEEGSEDDSEPKKNPVAAFFSPKPKEEDEKKVKRKPAPKSWIPLNRNRPEQEIDEETDKPKVNKWLTRRNIAIGIVAAILLTFLVFRVAGAGDEPYAAVCIDDRTMARQADNTLCEEDVSDYFRWWYVPEGEYVPPVGGVAITGNGSTNEPSSENAAITYGFESDGGVFGGD